MASFARVEDGVVVEVLVVPNEHEHDGEEYLNSLGLHGRWLKTSYNTAQGKHGAGGTPFRINFAGIGMLYDEELDGFVYPKGSHDSFVFNPETGTWESPVPVPEDGGQYFWSESQAAWVRPNGYEREPEYEVE